MTSSTKLHLICVAVFTLLATSTASAKDTFNTYFADSTLRVDFVLSGIGNDARHTTIAFSQQSIDSQWAGRRYNLDKSALAGNADVIMTSATTGDTIYRQSFCTLFQEWLGMNDPTPTAMEGVVLLPMPHSNADVTINLRNNHQETIASATIPIDPSDIQIINRTAIDAYPSQHIFIGEAPDDQKIRIAILAEGYTASEMQTFYDHAREAADAILSHEPFTSMANHFDFIAIETESIDSGISIPKLGEWRNTAFGSRFSTFGSDRYLTSRNIFRIYDAITNSGCDHIIILANTDEYGGGGIFNFYTLTAAGHKNFREVVVHEFGHSFGGLADEYFYDDDIDVANYPLDIEPWEQNITTLVNFESKWQSLVDTGEASIVEGGGYRSHGIWRSANDCRMRTNSAEQFCPACQQALRHIIEFYTQPLIPPIAN